CIVHGLQFLLIRTEGILQERARTVSKKVTPITIVLVLSFVLVGLWKTDIFTYHGAIWLLIPAVALMALLTANILTVKRFDGWAFTMTSITIALLTASVFIGMFPRV